MVLCMFQCRFSIVPCCGTKEVPMFGMMTGEEFTCSVFDSGRCEPIKSFKNIQKHFELVGKLNDNNFEELRRQYFRDLQRLERERTAVSVPKAVSNGTEGCILPYQRVSTLLLHHSYYQRVQAYDFWNFLATRISYAPHTRRHR